MINKYANYDNSVAFEYDDSQFRLLDESGKLRYIGSETDGSNIQVPEGIVDGSALFKNTDIKSAPKLPDSLRDMTNMYSGCQNMTDPGFIPEGVTNIDGAYAYTGIRETPHMPDSINSANFAFDHCEDLERCDNFPQNMTHAVCMFYGDKSLGELPERLPDSLLYMNGFAADCPNLQRAPITGPNVKDMSQAYASCVRLENMPEVPEGAHAEDVVSDCYTLEHNTEDKKDSLSDAFQSADKQTDHKMDRDAAANALTDGITFDSDVEKQIGE